MSENLYDVLGVDKNATDEEIKKAYREKAKENHTDKGGDNDKMVSINKAWQVLKDPLRRKRYDDTGEQTETPFDQKFAAFTQDIFIKIVYETDVEKTDLIKAFKMYADKILEEQEKQKEDLDDKIKRLNKVIKRLKTKKGKNNNIAIVLDHNISALTQALHKLEEDIKFIKDCKEVIGHYNYKFEEPTEADVVAAMIASRVNFFTR